MVEELVVWHRVRRWGRRHQTSRAGRRGRSRRRVLRRHHGRAVGGGVKGARRALTQPRQIPGDVVVTAWVQRVRVSPHQLALVVGVLQVLSRQSRVSLGRPHPVAVHVSSLSQLWRRHPLLLLPPIAEPHPHHLLLQLQTVCQVGDLLRRRLGVLVEVLLKGALDADLDAGPLLPLPPLGGDLVDGGRGARGGVRLGQPLLEQGHELAHVLEAELEGLEPADGRLREDVAVERAEGEADVGLGEAELDPPLLELLGERLEVI